MSEKSTTKKTERTKNAEIIKLPVGIPGVGRAGDSVVSDPDHPNPRYRLTAVRPLEAALLPAIKERVETLKEESGGKKQKEIFTDLLQFLTDDVSEEE